MTAETIRQPEEKFIYAAIAATLTAGGGLGAYYLAQRIFSGTYGEHGGPLINIHAHVQLFAWVGLFIMGMASIILPRFKSARLRSIPLNNAAFALMIAGLLSWTLVQGAGLSRLALLPPALETIAAAIFAYNITRTMLGGKRFVWDKFVYASLAWFTASAAYGLVLSPALLADSHEAMEAAHLYYLLVTLGFIANMIMGVNIRTLPAFLGLRRANDRAATAVFAVYNLSLVVMALSLAGIEVAWFTGAALWLAIGSLLAFTAVIGMLSKTETDLADHFAVETSYMNFLRGAYVWLVAGAALLAVSSLLPLAETQADGLNSAALHALGFGFVTGMIFGYATKALPIFKGTRLYSPALNNLTFLVFTMAATMRVATQVGFAFGLTGLAPALALSGTLQFLAVAMFAYNIWRTVNLVVDEDEEDIADFSQIGAQSVVYDVLARYPDTLQVFLTFGFSPLANPVARRTLARTVSIRTACRMTGVDEAHLLKALNDSINEARNPGLAG